MNDIQQLKDSRAKMVIDVEAIEKEIPPFEAALVSEEVINHGRVNNVRHEISARKLKIDAINHRISLLDRTLSRRETLANRESLMAGYIADMTSWVADEVELNTKRQSLSVRLDEVRKQTEEEIANARQAET
ncbi:MAG TPA: hypothetical protein VGC24_05680, partial [Burkholderiaceae bacterium]